MAVADSPAPDTGAMLNSVFACATSSKIEVTANLRSSIEGLLRANSAQGYATIKNDSGFVSLIQQFPEADRVKAYEIYVKCIKDMIAPRSEHTIIDNQNEFLYRFRSTTTLTSLISVFGPAEERTKLFFRGKTGPFWTGLRFQTASKKDSLFTLLDKPDNIVAVALFHNDEDTDHRTDAEVKVIPFLDFIESPEDVSQNIEEYHNLNDWSFKRTIKWCSDQTGKLDIYGDPNFRYGYFTVGPCYFGRPGTFKDYFFVFTLDDFVDLDAEKCAGYEVAWGKISAIDQLLNDCTRAGSAKPILVFVSLLRGQSQLGDKDLAWKQNTRKAGVMTGAILDWIYFGEDR
jgi:hypothetical protein